MSDAKRKRYEKNGKDFAATRQVMISEMERVFLSWVIGQLDGLDKDGSRKVGRIIDEFDLETFDGISPDERYNTSPYDLSGYEITFLVDEIDGLFSKKKIVPAHAKASTSLYDKLKAALEEAEPEAAG